MGCGGDSGIADCGVVGGHGLKVSKRLPGVFAGSLFGAGFRYGLFGRVGYSLFPHRNRSLSLNFASVIANSY